MAPHSRHELEVSTHNYTHEGAATATVHRCASDLHRSHPRTTPLGEIPVVEVLFLEAYVSELERELDRREEHREELVDRYESVLEEQHRMYQTRIHELEGYGCSCETTTASSHSQNHEPLISSLLNRLYR